MKRRWPPSSGGPNCTAVPVVDCERQMLSPLAERISAYSPDPGVSKRVSSTAVGVTDSGPSGSAAAISATICASSTSRSERSEACRNSRSSRKTVSAKKTTSTASTDNMSRRLSEGRDTNYRPLGTGRARNREAVAAAAQRLDGMQRFVGIELAAQPAYEDLDDVAVALVILVVEPLGELGF